MKYFIGNLLRLGHLQYRANRTHSLASAGVLGYSSVALRDIWESGRQHECFQAKAALPESSTEPVGSYTPGQIAAVGHRVAWHQGAATPLLGQLTASSSQFINKRGIYLGRRSTKLHVALYRRSGGRIGGHIPGWPEARIVLVDHTGAKSGAKRTSPVMYLEDGDTIVVMASKAGQPTHPAWFHNLKANPDTTIQIGAVVSEVRARVASDEERDRLWSKFVAMYPGSEFYQRSAEGREIPIVILDPR